MTREDERLLDEARHHLTVVLSAIDAASSSRQVPMLREFFIRRIDQLELAERDLYDFIAECAQLAAQNMQDVRLATIEDRLDTLESGGQSSWADFVIDLALVMAVEVAIVVAPHLAVGVVSTLVGGLALSKQTRSLARASKYRAALAERRAKLEPLAEIDREYERLRASAGGTLGLPWDPVRADAGNVDLGLWAGPGRRWYERAAGANQELQSVLAAERRVDDQIAMLRSSQYRDKVEKRIYDIHPVLTDKWQKIADHANDTDYVEVSLRRVGEDLGMAFKKYVTDGASDGTTLPPFTTTSALSEQLRQLRAFSREAANEYSSLRAFVHFADDSDLLDDAELHAALVGLIAAANRADEAVLRRKVMQDALIAGFEIPLWALWLKRTGGLEIGDRRTVHRPHAPGSPEPYDEGDDYAGIVIDAVRGGAINNVPSRFYDGHPYPGRNKLSDHLAHYLFERFAKVYLRDRPKVVPFDFDEAELSAAPTLPEMSPWGIRKNQERLHRFTQLKVCVILALRDFIEERRDLSGMGLFDPSDQRVDDVFVVDERIVPDAETEAGTSEPSETDKAAVRAMLEESGALEPERANAYLSEIETRLRESEHYVEWHRFRNDPAVVENLVPPADMSMVALEDNLWVISTIRSTLEQSDSEAFAAAAEIVNKAYDARIRAVDAYVTSAPAAPDVPAQHTNHTWHFDHTPTGSTP